MILGVQPQSVGAHPASLCSQWPPQHPLPPPPLPGHAQTLATLTHFLDTLPFMRASFMASPAFGQRATGRVSH